MKKEVTRVPNFYKLRQVWKEVSPQINFYEEVDLSQVFGSSSNSLKAGETRLEMGEVSTWEIAGAHGFRALSKGYESIHGMAICANGSINFSQIQLGYLGAFYLAKSFIIFCGYVPLNRTSKITANIFEDEIYSKSELVSTELNVRLIHFDERWSHDTVWKLFSRLINLTNKNKTPPQLLDAVKYLKRCSNISSARNRLSYDDSKFPFQTQTEFRDTADSAIKGVHSPDAPEELLFYQTVFWNVAMLVKEILYELDPQFISQNVIGSSREQFIGAYFKTKTRS